MSEEFREILNDAVSTAVRLDVLSDEEALCIVRICRDAVSRAEADLTEQILAERIGGGAGVVSGEETEEEGAEG